MKHDDVKVDMAATDAKYSIKVASPLVTDDWKVDGSVAFEEKPQKSRKVTFEAGIESPDMGGVVAAVGVSTKTLVTNPGVTHAMGVGVLVTTSSSLRCNYRSTSGFFINARFYMTTLMLTKFIALCGSRMEARQRLGAQGS